MEKSARFALLIDTVRQDLQAVATALTSRYAGTALIANVRALNGIAYGQFQNDNVAMMEVELRWKATTRWSLLAFGGVGRDWGRRTHFNEAINETTRAMGFRYTIARALGLDVGVDWAWGPDDHAYYLQAGSAWR